MFHSVKHSKVFFHSRRSTLPFRPPIALSKIPLIVEDKCSETHSCNEVDAAALLNLYEGRNLSNIFQMYFVPVPFWTIRG